ncbi:MAG: site-specific integrase [Cyanobacteria bacterium P01_D01_bin.115]
MLSLVEFVPNTLRTSQLKPLDITQWLDANPTWKASGRRAAITAAKRALNWAVEQGVIDRNPIAAIKRPAMPRRTSTLTPEQRKLILDSAGDRPFRELLLAVQLSGVRRQEVRAVEARHFDAAKGTWVFPAAEHKTGARTGKPRVVFLPPSLVELCERLAKRWPEGPLFRNSQDSGWTSNAIRCRFKRLRNRLKGQLPDDLCLYLYRHTYATDALENGLNPVTVAELLGHADAATLSRVYQHVADRHDHMSQVAATATSQTGERLRV